MSDVRFISKKVKTRKEHLCFGCCKTIKSGEEVLYESGIFEGEFYKSYMCTNCQEYYKNKCKNCKDDCFYDGIMEGFVADCYCKETEEENESNR